MSLSPEEVRQLFADLRKPIDFDELISEGILERWGDGYHLLDVQRLPRHAGLKMFRISHKHPFGPTTVRFETFPYADASDHADFPT